MIAIICYHPHLDIWAQLGPWLVNTGRLDMAPSPAEAGLVDSGLFNLAEVGDFLLDTGEEGAEPAEEAE